MSTAVVLGANGQDGSYACEWLAECGKTVVGVGKQAQANYPISNSNYTYRALDLRNYDAVTEVLKATRPTEIYHLAAVHGSSGFMYEPVWHHALDVNVKVLHAALEYARQSEHPVKIFYPSSAKVFGVPLVGTINIDSPKLATCLYSASKICAANLIEHYRRQHKIHACIGYLFNHDSPRRPDDFFLPRIARVLNRAIEGRAQLEQVHTLRFFCDWGSAKEFMRFATKSLTFDTPCDFVLATGKTVFAQDLVRDLFEKYGLTLDKYITEKTTTEMGGHYQVDIEKTEKLFGEVPKISGLKVCEEIVEA